MVKCDENSQGKIFLLNFHFCFFLELPTVHFVILNHKNWMLLITFMMQNYKINVQ